MAESVDFRARFSKLLTFAVIIFFAGLVCWGVLHVAGKMNLEARSIRCKANMKTLVEAMTLYKSQYHDLPTTLAQLLPLIENRKEKLICPADPDHGTAGARPEWLRKDDGDLFKYTNLDGQTGDPEKDTDTVPCSYFYSASPYPCGLADFQTTWRDEFDSLVDQFGMSTPMVRCYYHLPEQYIEEKRANPALKPNLLPDPEAKPTYNITADLEMREYPLDWQSAISARPRP